MIDVEVAMIEIDQAVPATAAIGVEEVSGVRAAKDLTDPVEGGIDRWRERTDRFDGEMEWFNAGLDRDAAAILGFHKLAGPVLASRIDPIRKNPCYAPRPWAYSSVG